MEHPYGYYNVSKTGVRVNFPAGNPTVLKASATSNSTFNGSDKLMWVEMPGSISRPQLSIGSPPYKEVTHYKFRSAATIYEPVVCTDFPLGSTYSEARLVSPPATLYAGYWRTPHTLLANKKILYRALYMPPLTDVKVKMKGMMNDASLLNMRDINIVAFIGELKDVRNLIGLFKIKHLDDREISDKYLGVSFGALPFASDISTIVELIRKLPNAINKWQKLAASGRTLNKHIVIDKVSQKGTYTDSYRYGLTTKGPITWSYENSYDYSEEFIARGHVYFRAQELNQDLIDDLWRSVFGTNRLLGAAWQLLPWSFVVDWFLNIGDLIDRFEASDPILRTNIEQIGYSVKHTVKIKAHVHLLTNDRVKPRTLLAVNEYDYNYFARKYLSPTFLEGETYGPLKWQPDFSLYRYSLGAALIHQKLR
jgi:hypothetical protein